MWESIPIECIIHFSSYCRNSYQDLGIGSNARMSGRSKLHDLLHGALNEDKKYLKVSSERKQKREERVRKSNSKSVKFQQTSMSRHPVEEISKKLSQTKIAECSENEKQLQSCLKSEQKRETKNDGLKEMKLEIYKQRSLNSLSLRQNCFPNSVL